MQQNPQIYSISKEKAILDKIRKAESLRGFVTSPGHLRQDILIDNNKTTYAFDLSSTNRINERPQRLLSDKDVFITTRLGVLLAQKNTQKAGAEVLQSFPSPHIFNGTAQTAADLEAFYSAELIIQIDNTVVYDGMPTSVFRQVPETVKSASLTHSSYSGIPGLISIEPSLVLNGQRQQKFSIELPGFIATPAWQTTDTNIETTLVLYMTGFRINSAAEGHYESVVQALRG